MEERVSDSTLHASVPPPVAARVASPSVAIPEVRRTAPRHRTPAAIGGGLLLLIIVVAAASGGGDGSGLAASQAGAVTGGRTLDPGAEHVARGDRELQRRQHLDALAHYEKAIAASPSLAGSAELRASIASVLSTRDAVAGVVALELLASRVAPPARDTLVAVASNGKVAEVRRRAFAIAERDGFAHEVDRVESWTLDLKQATTCDDRKAAIERLRGTDRRAVVALRKARTEHACVEREATDAIGQLEAEAR
jgi:hypothetical protein